MIKEILTLRSFSNKLDKLGIKSIKSFIERCTDEVAIEDLRQQLGVNVEPVQWQGAVAVVKELFR